MRTVANDFKSNFTMIIVTGCFTSAISSGLSGTRWFKVKSVLCHGMDLNRTVCNTAVAESMRVHLDGL